MDKALLDRGTGLSRTRRTDLTQSPESTHNQPLSNVFKLTGKVNLITTHHKLRREKGDTFKRGGTRVYYINSSLKTRPTIPRPTSCK